MRLSLWLMELERKGVVSRHPHPILVFLLTVIVLLLGTQVYKINQNGGYALFALGFITFMFAILHWVVWIVLEKPKTKPHLHPEKHYHRYPTYSTHKLK